MCYALTDKFDAFHTRLQGERNFPMTTPKPVPTAIDLHMQCVDSSTSVGKLEEQYLRQSLKLARIYQVRIHTVTCIILVGIRLNFTYGDRLLIELARARWTHFLLVYVKRKRLPLLVLIAGVQQLAIQANSDASSAT